MDFPKLTIFDMDGVLVDSEDTFKRSCADALNKFGAYPEHDEFTKYTGMGDVLYIGGVAEAHGVAFKPEMIDESYKLYAEYAKETLKVFPWSRKILMALFDNKKPICVASSAGLFKVKVNLECVGVDLSIFETIISGDEVTEKKPAPDIFLKAAAKCGIDPADCLVFEDAISGVKAAKAAGMTACAVTTSFSAEELYEAGADFVCDDLGEGLYKYHGIKI